MTQIKAGALILLSAITLASIAGCEQAEQTIDNTVEWFKQSASETIDKAKQVVCGRVGETGGSQQADVETEQAAENDGKND